MQYCQHFISVLILLFINMACHSQSPQKSNLVNREPAVAGQFYPSDKAELERQINIFMMKAKYPMYNDVLAVIVPHAGYMFSGLVAASGFNQIDPEKTYENIFVIGTSHRASFEGAALYAMGNFITPLGTVNVNRSLCEKLINDNKVFINGPDIHWYEHCLEVELPFLQIHLKKPFQIVPILFGSQNISSIKKAAETLKPYFNEKNLFVISTDFSHYPSYDDACAADKTTMEAIISNNIEQFNAAIAKNQRMNYKGLSTSICGWSAVQCLLHITENMPNIKYQPIHYQNSGDVSGDKSRVVGYWSIAITGKVDNTETIEKTEFNLTKEEKLLLLKIARESIELFIAKKEILNPQKYELTDKLKQTGIGAFVTLHKNGNLRGCIGRFIPEDPLYKVIVDMAIAAAVNDSRFSPVKEAELKEIDIEISVLSPLTRIFTDESIELGKHGIYIKKGYNTGTFLPQVATETKWTKEEFLGHCSRDKAGLGWDGWKTAELYTYTALVFGEKEK